MLAIDPRAVDPDALNFGIYLSDVTNSRLTGVFLENTTATKDRPGEAYHIPQLNTEAPVPTLTVTHPAIDRSIQRFKDMCTNKSIRYNVHRARGIPSHEMIRESRFADLIVVDATTTFEDAIETRPTGFVRQLLKEAECPVILAPKSFDGIDEIIFTYDGSRSAAFAIKQFTYMFPQFDDRKIMILQVSGDGNWNGNDKYNFREWLQNRYSVIAFQTVQGEAESGLFDYLFSRKNAFVVMGAYGRGRLSTFFKPSHADVLIKKIAHPIFIAHC